MKMLQLWEVGHFVRGLRIHMRFGELTRAPLKLLRLQLQGKAAECDWMARAPDPWDADLPPAVGERNASLQALKDAMAVRELLFYALPHVENAVFRIYRQTVREPHQLIITGAVAREDKVPLNVRSLAMRARLFGFRFWLDDGVLEVMQSEKHVVSIS